MALFFRLAPGPGFAETTWPSGTFSSNALVTLPTTRLTSSIRCGRLGERHPDDGWHGIPLGALRDHEGDVGAAAHGGAGTGVGRDDHPRGHLLAEGLGDLGVEGGLAHGADRLGLGAALDRRHGGRRAGAEQEEPGGEAGDERGGDDGRPPATSSWSAAAGGDDPSLERRRGQGDGDGLGAGSGGHAAGALGCRSRALERERGGGGRLGGGDTGRHAGGPGVEDSGGERRAGAPHEGEELGGVGGPLVGVACGGDGDELVEGRRQARDPARRAGHPAVHVLVGDVDGGLAGEGLGAGEHLEEHQPGGVDVAAGVGDAALDLLGGEVGDGAEQHALGAGDGLARDRPGQPEVGDLDRAVVVDDDVLGLDVAVDQALGVRLGERLEHRVEHVEGRPRREQALLAHDVAQGLPGHVLHREEDVAVVLALVEHGDDVGVGQRRGRARLATEAGDEALVVGEVLAHHLQGDLAVEPLVDGEVDRRHPAVGDPTEHAVAPVEGAPDQRVAGG